MHPVFKNHLLNQGDIVEGFWELLSKSTQLMFRRQAVKNFFMHFRFESIVGIFNDDFRRVGKRSMCITYQNIITFIVLEENVFQFVRLVQSVLKVFHICGCAQTNVPINHSDNHIESSQHVLSSVSSIYVIQWHETYLSLSAKQKSSHSLSVNMCVSSHFLNR